MHTQVLASEISQTNCGEECEKDVRQYRVAIAAGVSSCWQHTKQQTDPNITYIYKINKYSKNGQSRSKCSWQVSVCECVRVAGRTAAWSALLTNTARVGGECGTYGGEQMQTGSG
jgi:hypothetical protein